LEVTKTPKKYVVSTYLENQDISRLDELSRITGYSRSALIRRAVLRYLEEIE